MKKIINKKKYDTDTAEVVHRKTSPSVRDDIMGVTEETLYKKKNGEFFSHCRYGRGQEYLTVLEGKELQEWYEEYMTVEEYEAMFGEVSE